MRNTVDGDADAVFADSEFVAMPARLVYAVGGKGAQLGEAARKGFRPDIVRVTFDCGSDGFGRVIPDSNVVLDRISGRLARVLDAPNEVANEALGDQLRRESRIENDRRVRSLRRGEPFPLL